MSDGDDGDWDAEWKAVHDFVKDGVPPRGDRAPVPVSAARHRVSARRGFAPDDGVQSFGETQREAGKRKR